MMKLLPVFARMLYRGTSIHRENQKMDEKKIAVILGVTGVIVILLTLFWPTSPRQRLEKQEERRQQTARKSAERNREEPASSDSRTGYGSSSGGSGSQSSSGSLVQESKTPAGVASMAVIAGQLPAEVASETTLTPGSNKVKPMGYQVTGSSGDAAPSSVSGGSSVSLTTKKSGNTALSSGGGSDSGGNGGSSGGSSGSSGSSPSGAESAPAFQSARELSSASKNETPRLAFTEEEAKVMRAKREALLSRIFSRKQSWVASRASSGSGLSAKTQARYRLKMIEGYADGNEAMKKGNWAEAIKAVMAGVKDPDADPITKYTCFDQMRMCAKMLKDYDLYLEVLKEQGRLIENDDLSILGIEKSTMGTRFYETRRQFVQAIKDPVNGFKKSIDEILQASNLKEEDRAATEERFRQDLADWQADFDKTS